MSRRPKAIVGGKGLYKTVDEFGYSLTWEPLPPVKPADPADRLLAESTPKVGSVGGLYEQPSREGERRRRADL
jgi:hypothetical protein